MTLAFIKPRFAALIFGISSAITCTVLIVVSRMVFGGMLGIGDRITGAGEIAANLGVDVATLYALTFFVPVFFCTGWISGYVAAVVLNALSSGGKFLHVPVGSLKLEEN